MKIISVIPVWQRPDILIEHLKSVPDWLAVIYVISKEDPYLTQIKEILKGNYIEHTNKNVSGKINAGIRIIKDYDYLMNLGSDSIINKDLLKYYLPYLKNYKFIARNKTYFQNYKTKETYLYQSNKIGSGRIIHKSIIDKIYNSNEELYTNNISSGMDADSMKRIKRITGINLKVVNIPPMTTELKSDMNITPINKIISNGAKRINI